MRNETEEKYPQLRWLDSVYVDVEREGKVVKRCFTDLSNEEQKAHLDSLTPEQVESLCMLMAGAVRGIGDIYGLSFVGLEEEV